nr:MAG TPA: hypothetical protein [Crassvirales sp.]
MILTILYYISKISIPITEVRFFSAFLQLLTNYYFIGSSPILSP